SCTTHTRATASPSAVCNTVPTPKATWSTNRADDRARQIATRITEGASGVFRACQHVATPTDWPKCTGWYIVDNQFFRRATTRQNASKGQSVAKKNQSQPRPGNAAPTVSFGRITHRSTPASVADVLRTAILDGKLKPGSQLRETQ